MTQRTQPGEMSPDVQMLADQCHGIIQVLARKRLAVKLLLAALDGLRMVAGYKDPEIRPKPRKPPTEPISAGDLLKM